MKREWVDMDMSSREGEGGDWRRLFQYAVLTVKVSSVSGLGTLIPISLQTRPKIEKINLFLMELIGF
jgi:hypothetical protein